MDSRIYRESGDLPWTMPSKVDMGVAERSTEMDRADLSVSGCEEEREREREKRSEVEDRRHT